jgi:hypothetical protein
MVTIHSHQRPGLQRRGQPGLGRGTAGLAWATAVLALGAAVLGLVLEGVYTGARSTAEILRGFDAVTAVLVAPALAVSVGYARRGSVLGRLVTAGLLADLVYSYAFYVFGTDFNDLFLLHVVVFSMSLTALVLTIGGLDVDAVGEQFRGMRHVWPVAVATGVLAVSLGGMWVGAAVVNGVNGTVPVGSRLVETPEMIHTALVLDLAVQVPLYAGAAVLLWRREAWGFVLAFVATLSGIPEQLSYLVGMPFQVGAGVPDAASFDPLEPVIAGLYVLAFGLLLAGASSPGRDRSGAGGGLKEWAGGHPG